MRFNPALLCLVALASASLAQEAPPLPERQEPPAQPQHGLSDLESTVNQLQDQPPPPAAEAPAETPVPAPPAPPPAPPRRIVPVAEQARQERLQFEAAVQRGRLLAAIARSGQVATQDMLAHISDPNGAGISGWIAEPEGNAVTVTFYAAGQGGAPPAAVYRVSILGGRVTARDTFLAGNRPALGAHEARMAAARAATETLDHRPCAGDDFNVFVIPPAAPDAPIDVYQLSPQTQRGHFPVGGHFKSTIAPDGSVANSQPLAEACADLAVAEVPAGQTSAPLAVTRAALPNEIDVFLAMWTGRPLAVTAGDPPRRFTVTGETIAPAN